MNNKGQITAEYILLLSIFLVIVFSSINMITSESEKNTIMTAAHIGAQTGIDKNGYAMYYNDTFNNYQEQYPRLLVPAEIKIVSIAMTQNDNLIELQVTATTSSLSQKEKNITGSRINYYIRQTITETFKKENMTNQYYDPAKSDNYQIKTKSVKWK